MQWWINFPFFRPSSLYLKCYSQWSSVNKIKKFFSKTHLGNIVFHFTLDFCLTVKIIMQASFIIHTAAKFQSWKFTKWLLPWVQIYQHNCSNLMYQIMFIVLKLHALASLLQNWIVDLEYYWFIQSYFIISEKFFVKRCFILHVAITMSNINISIILNCLKKKTESQSAENLESLEWKTISMSTKKNFLMCNCLFI